MGEEMTSPDDYKIRPADAYKIYCDAFAEIYPGVQLTLEELAWMATGLANQLERVPRLIASSDAGEGALSEQELAMIVTALRAFALSTSKEGK